MRKEMAAVSSGPARNRDEIYIEYPNTIRIESYKEFMTVKNQLKRVWPIFLLFVPFIPLLVLKGELYNQYYSISLDIIFLWIILVLIFGYILAFHYDYIPIYVFDLQNQTISQGRFRRVPLFKKKYIDTIFPFSAVKTIDANKSENELSSGKPYHHLNLQISFNNSDTLILLLHFPHSGRIQGLTFDIWQKLFQKVIESQPGTTTDDITKDYSIETVKMSYIKDYYTFGYN